MLFQLSDKEKGFHEAKPISLEKIMNKVPPMEPLSVVTDQTCLVRKSWIGPATADGSPPRPVQVSLSRPDPCTEKIPENFPRRVGCDSTAAIIVRTFLQFAVGSKANSRVHGLNGCFAFAFVAASFDVHVVP